MDDCVNSYCYDVRNGGGACFCTNKHAKLSSKTILSRWNCDHSNDQQVAGAVGIAVLVSIFSAKQGSSVATGMEFSEAAASGSSTVFYISLILAVVNIVLAFFLKAPSAAHAKAKSAVKATETVQE